jgi:DNA modification methylase
MARDKVSAIKPAFDIEWWPTERPVDYPLNARKWKPEAVAKVAASIQTYGWRQPLVVDDSGIIVIGHLRRAAARQAGLPQVPVHVAADLSPEAIRGLRLADNRTHDEAEWDMDLLAREFGELKALDFHLESTGFSLREIDEFTRSVNPAEDDVPPVPEVPVTQPGDLWQMGGHRLICGDCREAETVRALFADALANVVVTSPPYATQREYDPSSGFKPVPPEEYVEWYRDVAANIAAILADDGSYLLNIKAHADEGERNLYVMDLVLAHRRQWCWRFVDEFCWRKTDNGVPGGWGNRFKNAFEPIYHFCKQQQIKFRAAAVSHASDDCFDYSPDNPKSNSGSGLLGTGARGDAAGKPGSGDSDGRHRGVARPSNVIEVKTESSQGSHSAPFPRALVEFFVKAFSDPGDIVFDPFLGSGTTMAAAHVLGRVGYGCEISPAYCDVIVHRWQKLTGKQAVLADGDHKGATFDHVREGRGLAAIDADIEAHLEAHGVPRL